MTQVFLGGSIHTDAQGYETLMDFYTNCQQYNDCQIEIDLGQLVYIDGNLCAFWLALLEDLKQHNGLTFHIDQRFWLPHPKLYGENFHVLFRNKFVPTLHEMEDCFKDFIDERYSTIELRKFGREALNEFVDYIEKSFLEHRGCALSQDNKDYLYIAYTELFNNYTEHAQTEQPVYVCGQYFPKRNKQLIFTLTDVGKGFLEPIRAYTQDKSEPITDALSAIKWAVQGKNTTRPNEEGGNGLVSIVAFCHTQPCVFHLIADGVYTYYEGNTRRYKPLRHYLKGTTAHLIFQ
jgi:hypothetical protein